ncbi:MAG: type II CRISPR RNA-guided endonuclease Cas9 [Bacteroidales bacterium]|jgi:CRISPR-associated endonuclease Csn1|nr:type II CRISPR RNA-guided endonuclease Cas9 [Bacteroidales bacterium]
MKKILGINLEVPAIGWAVVNEAENENETSKIISLGVRVNPLNSEEIVAFEKGGALTTNSNRTTHRLLRRNIQRRKLRKENLINILIENGFINKDTILHEKGKNSTYETLNKRSFAVNEKISLEDFARVLLMINKKRGYKSNGKLIKDEQLFSDSLLIAKKLYEEKLTPAQYCLSLLDSGNKNFPSFYISDLKNEFSLIWERQKTFYPHILTEQLRKSLQDKTRANFWFLLQSAFNESEKIEIIKRDKKGEKLAIENLIWRKEALENKMSPYQIAIILQDINNAILSSSNYLGKIYDNSKELLLNNLTIGQYLVLSLKENTLQSLKDKMFFRQDYINEFNILWNKQAEFYKEEGNNIFNDELKKHIRDNIIFYQRPLKSQKRLIHFCKLETKNRVSPKSSPLYEEFNIWNTLNSVRIFNKNEENVTIESGKLSLEEKNKLYERLKTNESITKQDALKILNKDNKKFDLSYKLLQGDKTNTLLFKAYNKIIVSSGYKPINFSSSYKDILSYTKKIFEKLNINTSFLEFNYKDSLDNSPYYKLWHLIYSFEGDNSYSGKDNLIKKLQKNFGFNSSSANILSNISFEKTYGDVSSKAIKNILPFMKEGHNIEEVFFLAGYKKKKEEEEEKKLKETLPLLGKNALRNPVIEKIINQLIQLVTSLLEEQKEIDQIRITFARTLKLPTSAREVMFKKIRANRKINELLKEKISREFNKNYVSYNDIIRYKLYSQLKDNNYHSLYSNTFIEKEKLFTDAFSIDHIIPKNILFDESLSNKTIELTKVNKQKGEKYPLVFIEEKYGVKAKTDYIERVERLFKDTDIKLRKLLFDNQGFPHSFIERDLKNTQYVPKFCINMLNTICEETIASTHFITDSLRKDWDVEELIKEINWEKYANRDLVEINKNKKDSKKEIKNWNHYEDYRLYALNALVVSFTNEDIIDYLSYKKGNDGINNKAYRIRSKYFTQEKVNIPMPNFKEEAKKHLEKILVSIKAKNKVATKRKIVIKKQDVLSEKTFLTPRGQLHNETVYGASKRIMVKKERVNLSFNEEKILLVAKKKYRDALLERLQEFNYDSKKAFSIKNSLENNPVYYIDNKGERKKVPLRVDVHYPYLRYTIRKKVDPFLAIDKVVDNKIRAILQDRLKKYNNNAIDAFSSLEDNPIWLNEEKKIPIKRVAIRNINAAAALRKEEDEKGNIRYKDYVQPANNHHVEVFINKKEKTKGYVVSFLECINRVANNRDIINKEYEVVGYNFLFSIKQNETFLISSQDFKPKEMTKQWLMDKRNYKEISSHIYRVQKIASDNRIYFRSLADTTVKENLSLNGVTFMVKQISSLKDIVKVRVNNLGQIVHIGE